MRNKFNIKKFLKFGIMTAVIGILGIQFMIASAEDSKKDGWKFLVGDKNILIGKHGRGCNKALVSGVYGFNARGFVATGPGGDEPNMIVDNERQAGAGIAEFRSNGTATFTLERFFSEGVTDQPQPVSSTFDAVWSINSDCTGMVNLMEFGDEVDWVFVAVSHARELHLVSGTTLTAVDAKRLTKKRDVLPKWLGWGKRTSQFRCNMKAVAGRYGGNIDSIAGQINGQNNAFIAVYYLRADGTLNIKMEGFTENADKTVSPLQLEDMEGTWQVNPDCTGSMQFEMTDPEPMMVKEVFVSVENASEILTVGNGFLDEFDGKRLFDR